ncbi:MAG TPA: alpha/beta fold hydrolase [Polyangiaceae bacterium]|nr:alpha/beta fold hydrolase [Polyangiaceae bacterium]
MRPPAALCPPARPAAAAARRPPRGTVRLAPLLFALAACAAPEPPKARPAAAPPPSGYAPGEGGERLFFRTLGEGGTPVVVVHGGPGLDMDWYVDDLRPLARARRLVFYDQRGGGRSSLPADPNTITMQNHVRDLEALRRHLGAERIALLAHSFGPSIAALYAIEHPDRVERLALVGPIPPAAEGFERAFEANLSARAGREASARMAELERAWADAPDPIAVCREYWRLAMPPRLADPAASLPRLKADPCAPGAEAMRYSLRHTMPRTVASLGTWDFRPALARLRVPTLVVHGEDELIPMGMVEGWARSLPEARLLRVPKSGHFPYVERPELVMPALEAFFGGRWPEGAERPR